VPIDQREWPKPTNQHQGFVKFDNQVSSGHAVSGRYRIDRNLQIANGISGLNTHDRGSDSLTRDQDGVLSDTLVLSNRLLNEFRFQASQRYNNSDTSLYSPVGTPDIRRPSGNFGKANNQPQWRKERRYQFVDNFSITRSNHDVKFGADISMIRGFSFFPRTNDGQFMFSTDKPFDPADLSTYPIQYTPVLRPGRAQSRRRQRTGQQRSPSSDRRQFQLGAARWLSDRRPRISAIGSAMERDHRR